MQITPFKIAVPQTALDELQQRLAGTRWPDEAPGTGWGLGADLAFMKRLVDHWQHRFDWRAQETALNQHAQFQAELGGTTLHFVHERGKGPSPTPLLLLHGWPDSFYRFHAVTPLLADPARFGGDPARSFDVIVPSLPGFGFSARQPMAADATADLLIELMQGLGYQKFVVSGGDLGSVIAMSISQRRPEVLLGIHVTDVGYPDGTTDFAALSDAEREFAGFIQGWWMREGAFNLVQATKPQGLAFAMNDSPAGLAAWMMSMIASGTDDKLEQRFSFDELLTNFTIYWVTETIGSSMRTYAENARAMWSDPQAAKPGRSAVPAAVAHMPWDAPLPREWAERHVNLRQFTELPRGGHFTAWEAPEAYARDLHDFLGVLRG